MIDAITVANTILKRGKQEDIPITPMKLQKIVYFIYRDYLQQTGQPLFSERFEPWDYGPVIRDIYDAFKKYGRNHIKKYAVSRDGKTAYVVNEKTSPKLSEIIDIVWAKCKYQDGISLSKRTHEEGGAWRKAYLNSYPYLLDEDIKEENIQIA